MIDFHEYLNPEGWQRTPTPDTRRTWKDYRDSLKRGYFKSLAHICWYWLKGQIRHFYYTFWFVYYEKRVKDGEYARRENRFK